jgi:hypothetical protein
MVEKEDVIDSFKEQAGNYKHKLISFAESGTFPLSELQEKLEELKEEMNHDDVEESKEFR